MVAFLIHVTIMAGMFAILSLSLNFQFGITGLMNFGHAMFFAIGAYASALLTLQGLPALLGVALGMILAALFAMLISLPTSGLKEDYWAIVTIAAAESLRLFIINEKWLAEGPFGLRGIPRPLSYLFGDSYTYFYVILVLICLILTYFFLEQLTRSPFGRVLRAIREGEEPVEAMGRNVFRFKMTAMVIGAVFAALAGSLYAHYITFISPEDFTPVRTFLIWTMVVIGGRGNNLGVILGAATVETLNVSTRFLKDQVNVSAGLLASLRTLTIGALLVLFMLFRPKGVIPEARRHIFGGHKEGQLEPSGRPVRSE